MENQTNNHVSYMPDEKNFHRQLAKRHQRGKIGQVIYYISIGVALLALITLFANVINQTFGTIAVQFAVSPESLVPEGEQLSTQSQESLLNIINENIPNRLRLVIRDNLSQVDSSVFTTAPIREVLAGQTYDEAWADLTINDLEGSDHLQILGDNLSADTLRDIIVNDIVELEVLQAWSLIETTFNYDRIIATRDADFPDAELRAHSWLDGEFLREPMSSVPSLAGIRTALMGSVYLMIIVVSTSLPVGIGAAIYLEEYASDNWLNRMIETNVRNLAGVPSIIYGMLGLTIFVRVLEQFTSGAFVGADSANGRTLMSAGLTLSLLILPIIIINAQEAIRAVPNTIREASYGLGATQWQTIWRQILPAALPGIMTGAILAVSRAVGETAPLIVVGAATFIVVDPSGPFSNFTALPIQIFEWAKRPQAQFQNIAAAAIIVLLIVMLTLNATAIFIRNRYRIRY